MPCNPEGLILKDPGTPTLRAVDIALLRRAMQLTRTVGNPLWQSKGPFLSNSHHRQVRVVVTVNCSVTATASSHLMPSVLLLVFSVPPAYQSPIQTQCPKTRVIARSGLLTAQEQNKEKRVFICVEK
jgi:hypothetical protein